MARIVMWLNAALLLLISMAGVAQASALYVDCNLKKDWLPYKTGDYQRFVLPDFNRTLYDNYREHCDFLYEFGIVIDGDIDQALEQSMTSLKNILISDVAFKRVIDMPGIGIDVDINSNGGDVSIALQVGRILRELNAVVFIGRECTSSCVFLLAGGISRHSLGRVGVHRPYFSALSPKLTPAEVSRAYEEQRALIAKFLTDMHIPSSSLLDFMEETEPGKIHYLTRAEMTKYQLEATDPIFDEMLTARQAEMRGITSTQYRKRVAEEDTICGNLDLCYSDSHAQYEQCSDRHWTCAQAVRWGLSISEYSKRQKEAQSCASLRESASVDVFVACIKAAMLGR